MECPAGYKFGSVASASYGEPKPGKCSDTAKITAALKIKCVGKQACTIAVNKAILGDPCPKKLKVFSCKLACKK